jgi:hypothetical protein
LKSLCEVTFLVHMVILKGFYCWPKKLGSTQKWILKYLMWIFWTCNHLFQDHNDVQCSMGYGLAYGSQFSVQVLEEDFFQCTIMCLILWVHKSGKICCDSNFGICERWENFLNLDVHEYKTAKSALWAWIWWFICLHNLSISLIPFIMMMSS